MSKSKPHIPCCTEVSLPYHGQNTDSTRENGDFSFVIPKKRKGTGLKKNGSCLLMLVLMLFIKGVSIYKFFS